MLVNFYFYNISTSLSTNKMPPCFGVSTMRGHLLRCTATNAVPTYCLQWLTCLPLTHIESKIYNTSINNKLRRGICFSSTSSAPNSADDIAQSPPLRDEHFMRMALEQAQLASHAGEVPVGAVIVSSSGEILAAAHNTTEASHDPTCHAEMQCIRQAAKGAGGWRLIDSTLYVTLEPCPMCAGAILQARVGSLVYGARSTLLGADGSWIQLLQAGTTCRIGEESHGNCSCGDTTLSHSNYHSAHPFHPNIVVRKGVLADECGAVMRSFFRTRRRQRDSQWSSDEDEDGQVYRGVA